MYWTDDWSSVKLPYHQSHRTLEINLGNESYSVGQCLCGQLRHFNNISIEYTAIELHASLKAFDNVGFTIPILC